MIWSVYKRHITRMEKSGGGRQREKNMKRNFLSKQNGRDIQNMSKTIKSGDRFFTFVFFAFEKTKGLFAFTLV